MAEDPKVDGELSPTDIQYIASKLKNVSPFGYMCPVCKCQKFLVANALVSPIMLDRQGVRSASEGMFPQVMIVCEQCGFTGYHNAKTMGVFDSEEGGGDAQ